jgi:hypothetical protein
MERKSPYELDMKRMRKKFKHVQKPEAVEVVNTKTGEVDVGLKMVGHAYYADVSDFCKLYEPKVLLGLSKAGIAVFSWVMDVMRYDPFIRFDITKCSEWTEYKSRKSLYDGLKELVVLDILRPKSKMEYWINPNVMFKGDRGRLLR